MNTNERRSLHANQPKSRRRHQRTDRIRIQRFDAVLCDRSALRGRGAAAVVGAFFSAGGGGEGTYPEVHEIRRRRGWAGGNSGDRGAAGEVQESGGRGEAFPRPGGK